MRRTSIALILVACSVVGCRKKDDAAAASAKTTSAGVAQQRQKTGGTLQAKHGGEQATVTIGGAYATVYEKPDDVYELVIRLFNDGVEGTSCDTRIDEKKPLGGTGWAIELETESGGGWKRGSSEPVEASPTVWLKHQKSPYEGKFKGWRPYGSDATRELRIKSLTKDTLVASLDASTPRGDFVKGDFVARVCPPPKQ